MNFSTIKNLNSEIKYDFFGDLDNPSLIMAAHGNPVSIKQKEFIYLTNFVIQNKIKSVYEVATAFGISALAIGLGLRETGGKLVTMDAYIEEQTNNCDGYRNGQKATYQDSDGYKSVKYLIENFGLKDVVSPEVGWSPDDTDSVLTKHFGNDKLDMVFIDAGHWDSAAIADLTSIKDRVRKGSFIFLHDFHCFSWWVNQFIKDNFNSEAQIVVPMNDGYNLALIEVK